MVAVHAQCALTSPWGYALFSTLYIVGTRMKKLSCSAAWIRTSLMVATGLLAGELIYPFFGRLGRMCSLDREFRIWGPVRTWSPNIPALTSFAVLLLGGCFG